MTKPDREIVVTDSARFVDELGGPDREIGAGARGTVIRRRPSLGGRPSGSTNKLRAALVAEVRANPTMPDDQIDRRGVELGIWVSAPGDYEVIGKRVRRLRESATAQ